MPLGQHQAAELVGSLGSLIRTARAVGQRNRTELGAAGTPLGILKTLVGGDARPSDIAAGLHVGPSVVSRAIVPLEREGLVERTCDPADARASLLRLTDRGRDRLGQLSLSTIERVQRVLHDWSDDDAELTTRLLGRLEQAIAADETTAEQRRLTRRLIPGVAEDPDRPVERPDPAAAGRAAPALTTRTR
jgi:DNA-binding MarR family transcriptional regulator